MSAPVTYVLIHGAGDVGWYWHLVEPKLRALGHDVIAPDLPVEDDDAGFEQYADVVIDAIGARRNLIVVAQSMGGCVAPLVCAHVPATLMVLVAAMVPSPGEPTEALFTNTGFKPASPAPADEIETFYQDVEPSLAKAALAHSKKQSETPGKQPWPLERWPDVPTRFLVCTNDRMFPATWLRRVVRERLGIEADEIESGHTPALSHPDELVRRLEAYRTAL